MANNNNNNNGNRSAYMPKEPSKPDIHQKEGKSSTGQQQSNRSAGSEKKCSSCHCDISKESGSCCCK